MFHVYVSVWWVKKIQLHICVYKTQAITLHWHASLIKTLLSHNIMYFIQLNSKTILKIPHVKIRYVLIVDTNLVTLANRVIINKLCKCLIIN